MQIESSVGVQQELESEDEPLPAGSPARMEQLFREQQPALMRMLSATLRDKEAAEEVAQAAYLDICRRERSGTRIELLRNYLFRVARHIAADYLRRRARRIRDAHFVEFHSHPGDAPSSEELCIREQEWALLEKAVQELPPKCREAFIFVEFDGWAVPAIAERMGIKQNTVYQLCKRANQHLVRALVKADLQRKGRQLS